MFEAAERPSRGCGGRSHPVFTTQSTGECRLVRPNRHPSPTEGKPGRINACAAKTCPEARAPALASCPHCGRAYGDGSLHFLYSDEFGSYCHDCGSLLIECTGDLLEIVQPPYRLIIPKGLAGSELHRELRRFAAKDGAAVLVGRSDALKGVELLITPGGR